IESGAGVLDRGQRNQDAAIEVGEHPVGAGLGRVDGDDAEVLGADRLDARGQEAAGLAEVLAPLGAAGPASCARAHGWYLRKRLRVYSTPPWRPTGGRRREEIYSLSRTSPDTSHHPGPGGKIARTNPPCPPGGVSPAGSGVGTGTPASEQGPSDG